MTSSYRRLVLHPFVVLLMLVAMVFVTAADAAACGAEVAPGNSAVWVAVDDTLASSEATGEDGEDSGVPVEQHGVCGHGHCHHGASLSGTVPKNSATHQAVAPAPLSSEALASNISNRLKRPPRA